VKQIESLILSLLNKEGYEPYLNNSSTVFAKSCDLVFSKFEERIKTNIISSLKSVQTPTKHYFSFYFITKNLFSDLFDEEASKIIMESIRKEMLNLIDFDTHGNVEEILAEIQKRELITYLNGMSGHEHVLFLWSSKDKRDKVLPHFFAQPDVPQGLISLEKMNLPAVENVTYSEILANKETATNQELQMITQIHQKNKTELSTRIAGIDCTQWFKNGLSDEFLKLEKQIDRYFQNNNISCVCGYNINEIHDNGTLKKLLKCHNYVMLDNPHSIFKKQI